MESLDCASSFVKERIEDIYGVLNVKGVIPIVGIVAYKTSIREYSIKEKWLNVGLNVLSVIPAIGDLVTLIKKSSIVINSELEGFKESVKESCLFDVVNPEVFNMFNIMSEVFWRYFGLYQKRISAY